MEIDIIIVGIIAKISFWVGAFFGIFFRRLRNWGDN